MQRQLPNIGWYTYKFIVIYEETAVRGVCHEQARSRWSRCRPHDYQPCPHDTASAPCVRGLHHFMVLWLPCCASVACCTALCCVWRFRPQLYHSQEGFSLPHCHTTKSCCIVCVEQRSGLGKRSLHISSGQVCTILPRYLHSTADVILPLPSKACTASAKRLLWCLPQTSHSQCCHPVACLHTLVFACTVACHCSFGFL